MIGGKLPILRTLIPKIHHCVHNRRINSSLVAQKAEGLESLFRGPIWIFRDSIGFLNELLVLRKSLNDSILVQLLLQTILSCLKLYNCVALSGRSNPVDGRRPG